MKNKSDMFLTFHLDEEIDCTNEEFGVICEQQGDRIKHYHKCESTEEQFVPSKFALMLIYIEENLEHKQFKLLAHKFDSHFKLSMMFHGEKLLPG